VSEKVSPKDIYDKIWSDFADDRKKSRGSAYANLQRALATNAAILVPAYMTAKEHVNIIGEIEQYTKSDEQANTGDPREHFASWLRGEIELSRVPLEKEITQ
jgi:hypothetical protein